MKKYILASVEAQKTVNLRNYGDIISNAVFDVIHEDDLVVSTGENDYSLIMDRTATSEEEAAIEKILSNSELAQYRTDDGILFTPLVDSDPYILDC